MSIIDGEKFDPTKWIERLEKRIIKLEKQVVKIKKLKNV